jgi:hypothetical protein
VGIPFKPVFGVAVFVGQCTHAHVFGIKRLCGFHRFFYALALNHVLEASAAGAVYQAQLFK